MVTKGEMSLQNMYLNRDCMSKRAYLVHYRQEKIGEKTLQGEETINHLDIFLTYIYNRSKNLLIYCHVALKHPTN